jgi:hypothetical protein
MASPTRCAARVVPLLLLLLLVHVAPGCSCDPERRGPSDGAAPGADASASDARQSTSADAPRADASGPEVCDLLDNDGNGIVDDVDVGGDGICDCLRIATLGLAGDAGSGSVFEAWLDARSAFGASDLADRELTPELLAQYQVIVARDIRGRERTTAERDALDAWIRSGGGFMTLIGYGPSSERVNVNILLAPTGIQYGAEGILYGGGTTLPVATWRAHPISEEVTRLGIDNGYPVTGAGTVVAEEGGHVVLRALEHGSGHVVVWGDEWISFDSEWTGHPDYQVERFWLNTIKWLTPPAECQVPILI